MRVSSLLLLCASGLSLFAGAAFKSARPAETDGVDYKVTTALPKNCQAVGAWLNIDKDHDCNIHMNNSYAAICYQDQRDMRKHGGATMALGFERDGKIFMQYVDQRDRMESVEVPPDVVQKHLRALLETMRLEAIARHK